MEAEVLTTTCLASFNDRYAAFRKRLKRYIATPDKEAIHDVRTSMRRLQLTYQVLPEACKTSDSDEYLHMVRDFFRLNSLVRDCDVITEKLQQHKPLASSSLQAILKRQRKKQLSAAMKFAKKLNKLPQLSLLNTDDNAPDQLRASIEKRAQRFLSAVPLVLEDEGNIEEAHELRKDAKKLFYLLELDASLASLRLVIDTKLVQRLAGYIHDSDVCTDFLQQHRRHAGKNIAAAIKEILGQERAMRHAYYKELCELLQDEAWQELEGLGATGQKQN